MTGLVRIALILLMITGCTTAPEVSLPNPAHLDKDNQERQFQNVLPAQVLDAAEVVLRQYQPKGHIKREGNTLVMEHQEWEYSVVAGADSAEKWIVQAQQTESGTLGSVAMRIRGSGFFVLLAGTYEYPNERLGIHIDYGMFWRRVQSAMMRVALPECEKRFSPIEVGARYFEPLCKYTRVNRGETK